MNKIQFDPTLFSRVSEHIERKIAESILNGKLRTGDRLPIEKEMVLHLRALDKYLQDIEKKPVNEKIAWVVGRSIGGKR